MVMRVSTFGQTSSVLANALNTQAKLAEKQEQQSTGLVSTTYAGLGSDASTVVDLEVSVSRAEATISAANTALTRVEEQYSALGSISDLLTDMRSEVNAVTSDEDLDTLQTAAAEMLEELTSLLNTQYQGRYLFAGSETTDVAVDLTDYEVTDLSTENTDYYEGDDYVQTVRLTDSRSLSYGITADNSAFEEAIRALSYLANADPLETSDLEEISDLLISSQDAVIALQSSMGYKADSLESLIESKEDYVSTVQSMVTDLTSVDVAEVAVEATTYETQLEASYSALGTLTSLSLLDYLR